MSAARRHRPTALCRLVMDWCHASREWMIYVLSTALVSPEDDAGCDRGDGIRFRRLESSDVDAVALHFPAELSPLRPRYVAEKLRRRHDEGVPGFVADEAGRIAGAAWMPMLEPHYAESPVLLRELSMPARRVANLFIVPAARGRGLGTWMLRCVVQWCQDVAEVGSVLSLVEVGNAASRRVHERVGFRRAARMRWESRWGRQEYVIESLAPGDSTRDRPADGNRESRS